MWGSRSADTPGLVLQQIKPVHSSTQQFSRRMCTLFRVSWQSDQVSMQQQKSAENQRLSLLFDVDDCWSLPIEPAQNRQPERLGSESTERRARWATNRWHLRPKVLR